MRGRAGTAAVRLNCGFFGEALGRPGQAHHQLTLPVEGADQCSLPEDMAIHRREHSGATCARAQVELLVPLSCGRHSLRQSGGAARDVGNQPVQNDFGLPPALEPKKKSRIFPPPAHF